MDELERLRKVVDNLDDEICDLLKKRFSVVKSIGEYKKTNGIAVTDTGRESAVYERIAAHFSDECEKTAGKNVYFGIIKECKKLQN